MGAWMEIRELKERNRKLQADYNRLMRELQSLKLPNIGHGITIQKRMARYHDEMYNNMQIIKYLENAL